MLSNLGWEVTVRLKVVGSGDAPDFSISVLFGIGSKRYDMLFGSGSSGAPIVMLASSFVGDGKEPIAGSTYSLSDGANEYHEYRLVYNPGDSGADLFVDGVERISNYTGSDTVQYSGASAMFFGAFGADGSGSANYNFVGLNVPEPGTGTMLLIGAGWMLGRRGHRSRLPTR
ncbi:MAG: PEP-CTERM sorting domain-containing protein [Gemmatimonadaceae bacterium]|nr:PEP-CTERM sorting domain-containing protein [Gemmatimonadaceae bacterium]